MNVIKHLIRKEFKQVFRDKAMIRIIFIIPIIQLLVLSYAANLDLKDVRIAILDSDHSPESRQLIDAFLNTSTGLFKNAGYVDNPEELKQTLELNQADLTLWIPVGYASDLHSGKSTEVAINIDGSNSSLAGKAAGYALQIINRETEKWMKSNLLDNPELNKNIHQITPVTRFFYNPELSSQLFMVPGIIVLLITIISALLTGLAIVKEKEIGTLEQLMVTPITATQFIIGKTLPFAILAFLEMTIATVFAMIWFKIPLVGSVFLLMGCSLLYVLVTLGVGIFASTISQTQQQALFTIWFFLVFGILLGGFFFPIDHMPVGVQYLTLINPVRYIITIVRSIFLKGATFADLSREIASLFFLGVLVFSAAVLRFQKRLK